MSKYTTEVRYICEQYSGLPEADYPYVNDVINASKSQIFDGFPIFDEAYRDILEAKILKHYYTREIAFETVALWKLKLNTKLNEIMPYYNQLYKSTLIEFNPLYDVDLRREYQRKNDGTTDGNGKNNSTADSSSQTIDSNSNTNWTKFNDTPQGGITGLEDDTYITTATKVTDSGNGRSDTGRHSENEATNEYHSKVNGIEDYVETVFGVNGGMSYSKKIMEFRKSFLNVDMEIINELKDLFFYLW